MYDKRIKVFYDALDFLFSIVRLISLTHFRTTKKIDKKNKECIVMGNGPSLSKSLKENEDVLGNYDLMAVNDMGFTPEFMVYKPSIYLLCDPAYWFSPGVPESVCATVRDFYRYMAEHVTWKIQLYLPYNAKKIKEIEETLSRNDHIRLYYYNKTKVEGPKWFQYAVIKRQWGMFRAQNVLVAALMLVIYSDYRRVYLMGAESDWSRNTWVDEQNRLRISDTHFYGDNDIILPHTMSLQCASLYFTFQSYQNVAEYANCKNIEIFNATPNSFVDAFERKKII
jgi:hypothetical protein